MESTVIWQRVEGALVFASALAIFFYLGIELPWWVVLLIFFAPDISFGAYLLGPRVGSFGYNIVHIYAFGALFLACGLTMGIASIAGIGALWLAHSGFDRMLGYGLKSPEWFNVTHMGTIGRASPNK